MLKNIHIRNFAVAENLNIDFQDGLNIVTGETGTGKSIIVGAIAAVLGGRVFTEVVRTGEEKAVVEAIFDISRLTFLKEHLEEKGLSNNDELFLRREISVKGSTRAFINDIPVTITTLSEIGDHLVDIHSQNEHQSLLRKETHRYFLDAFGKIHPLLERTEQEFKLCRTAEKRLQEMENRQKALEEKYDLYQFQVSEIEDSNIEVSEDNKLENERRILSNTEKIFSLCAEFNQLTLGNEELNLTELLGRSLHLLRELGEFSEDLKKIYQEFSSAKIIVEETTRSVEEFQNKLEYNPVRLEEIEQRLALISQLKKKYGSTIEEILEYKNKIKKELQLKENFEFELAKLLKDYQQKVDGYSKTVFELSKTRKKVSKQLKQDVINHLNKIGMPKTRFRVQIDWTEDKNGLFRHYHQSFYADEAGADQVEFYISTNPGEEFKPLAKIASGGEVSRIMLALKNILAENDQIPLLIFDEIDAGVSGKIALAVGKSIHQLASSHQIISITHLPQIAAFSDNHFRVEKFIKNGRTFTMVHPLHQNEKVEELARLMGGEKMSKEMLESAKQLLIEAGSIVSK